MRVLFFHKTASASGGGRNQYVLDVAGRLRRAGAQIALVHAREPRSEFAGTGYVFDHLDRHSRSSPLVIDKLLAILQDFGPDIIQLHCMDNHALIPTLRAHAPVVRFVHNHEVYCSGDAMTWSVPRRICHRRHGRGCLVRHTLHRCGSSIPLRNILRFREVSASLRALHQVDGIQVASAVVAENLQHNGIAAHRIGTLPLYAPAPAARARSLQQSRRMLLHPGGMNADKGVWLLLKNLDRLPPDVELIFAGGGKHHAQVDDFVKSRELGNRVRTMGDLSAAAWSELYHQSAFVLFPSRWNEPLGLAGLHAMAHGKAVAAFDVGGVTSWLRDGENGRLIRFNDVGAYFTAVNQMLSEPAATAAMGKRGLQLWNEQHRPERHVSALMNYYQMVIEMFRAEQ